MANFKETEDESLLIDMGFRDCKFTACVEHLEQIGSDHSQLLVFAIEKGAREFIELLGGTVDSGVPGFGEGVLLGSAAGGEEAQSMVGEPTIGSFLVGSLAVPSGLSFGVRRRVGPTGIKSLGVLGAGKWVLNAAGCDGGLWVGEGRVLVPAARGAVPDLNSDRVAAAVLLGLSGFSGGLNTGVSGVLEPTLGSDLLIWYEVWESWR
ncbi:hypothetical protein ACOSQ2_018499 [Xanthoceras sorbifolium]